MNNDSWFVLENKQALVHTLRKREEHIVLTLPAVEKDYRQTVIVNAKNILEQTILNKCSRVDFLNNALFVGGKIHEVFHLKKVQTVFRDLAMCLTELAEEEGIEIPEE